MEKFLTKIKEVLLKAKEEYAEDLDVMGYVETIRQNKDEDQIKNMINNCENIGSISYGEDETGGYTNGKLMIIGTKPFIKTYTITLLYESELKGYCRCKPTDEGYNEKHECCGEHCDWDFPVIEINSIEGTEQYKFKGTQKDLWNIQDGIVKETKQENSLLINEIRKLQNDNIKYINEIANNIYEINEKLNKLQRAM